MPMTNKRKLGRFSINPIGLGCMSLSQAYGPQPNEAASERLLHRALDLGCDFLDTAALYGEGHNETLVGRTLKARRREFTLASKCGFRVTPENPRLLDGSPAAIAETLDNSLRRLGLDHIDLYYLHRPDPKTPIEESVGALARAVWAGKIGAIGLSEVSAPQLRRAHAAHPIAALQTEYSLWTRNPEIAVLDACRDLGVTFVAFSPVARGFLAGAFARPRALGRDDIRFAMPRFQGDDFVRNQALYDPYKAIADAVGCTPAQLALAWLLHRDPGLVTIPGTHDIAHLEENMGANDVRLSAAQMAALDALVNQATVAGSRYNPAQQATVTTEEFA
ncbi:MULTISPECIES: aldo/keto reductase [unclassified Sphingomonas]|uniref:aldo/keto reductase n=1 Tax=unclassified Sphingomonas TaxID=196159 RepID=UPI0039E1349B